MPPRFLRPFLVPVFAACAAPPTRPPATAPEPPALPAVVQSGLDPAPEAQADAKALKDHGPDVARLSATAPTDVGPPQRRRAEEPTPEADAAARQMDKPRLFPWPCRDRFVRFGALGTFPGAPFYSLWNGIYNACPRSSPFREMQAAVEHRHGEERIPSYAMARYVATTPVFERLLRESRISCRPSDEPAWTYLLHAEGCRLPEAWRVRGISEKDLCMDAGAYLALLVLWTHYGGTTTLDQMFAQMVVDANEEACSAMVDQARQEQRAP